jgi:FMN phosphatase YigB (HAD superfamily)
MRYVIKKMGLDFEFTIGNPKRNVDTAINSIEKVLREHRVLNVDERTENFRSLLNLFGSIEALVELGRENFLKEVLGNDAEIIRVFHAYERNIFELTPNVREFLEYATQKGIECNIITDAPTEELLREIFLEKLKEWDLRRFFSTVYSPAGAIRPNGSTDLSYKGKTKRSGELYDALVEELRSHSITPQDVAIVGDDIESDIEQPKRRGFRTFQYVGAINRGRSEADQKISDWLELIRYV